MGGAEIRLFVGIELGPEVKASIQKAVSIFKDNGYRCRWVPLENIHLTLRFLGNCPIAMVEPIAAALAVAASRIKPFAIATESFGAFPSPRRARVLWLGLENIPEIQDLYMSVSSELALVGFGGEDRPFVPHITFARQKAPATVDFSLLNSVQTGHLFSINEVALFASHLSPKGAVYEVMARAGLGPINT